MEEENKRQRNTIKKEEGKVKRRKVIEMEVWQDRWEEG